MQRHTWAQVEQHPDMWSMVLPVIPRCEFVESDNRAHSEPSRGDHGMERPHTVSIPNDQQDVAMEREDRRVSRGRPNGVR